LEHKHKNIFIDELIIHWKFTIGSVVIASLIIAGYKFMLTEHTEINTSLLFEGFFTAHLLFASVTPASLISRYMKAFIPGIMVAIISSLLTCTLSDIIFPYLGAVLLGYEMHLHICIIEEPLISAIFILSGAFCGYILSSKIVRLSKYTHMFHIILSAVAAGLYLITYGAGEITLKSVLFIPVIAVSVLTPCILNDIAVPVYFITKNLRSDNERKNQLDRIHSEHHDHHH
jgi:hypothetical protein